MKKGYFKALCCLLFLGFQFQCNASHLVGGDLTYECLGSNRYKISLVIYRDCLNGQAPFDNPAYFFIYNNDTRVYRVESLGTPSISVLPSEANNPCLTNPPNVCLEKGEYNVILTLGANTNGYRIIYQRCCRNGGIINLYEDPFTGLGSTYAVNIPGGALSCNSTPKFKEFPPTFLCAGSKSEFDFSATDKDGDVLKYSICPPNNGANRNNPMDPTGGISTYPTAPLPFSAVTYETGFSALKPLGLGSILSIDPNTGLLTAIPAFAGLFVVGICVEEYRAGVLIGKVVRDFQFNVANCSITSSIPSVVVDNTNAIYQLNDTTFSSCNGLTVNFKSNSSGIINSTYWDFGDPNLLSDTSILKDPTYTFSDTGVYHVTLIVNRGQSCTDTSTMQVQVYRELTGNFLFTNSCKNNAVPFIDSSRSYYNDVIGWKWFFGDGDSIEVQNPTHLYNSPGTYSVNLTATTQKGCKVKSTKSVVISPAPNADFILRQVCYGIRSLFSNTSTISGGTIVKYYWDFGNGSVDSVNTNPTTIYPSNNNYTVQLIAMSNNGCRDTVVKNIAIIDSLIPDFSFPVSNCQNATLPFTNISTGNYTGYTWNFRDSLNSTSTVKNPTFTFTKPGTYPVKLTVNHAICGADSITKNVVIKPQPAITLNQNISLCNGNATTLTVPNNYDSIRWNTGQTTNTISVNGSVNPVSILVYKNGCSNTDATTLTVRPVPNADFNLRQVCYGIRSLLTNNSTISTGSIVKNYWTFGNGTIDSVNINPTTVYPSNTNYTVQLIAVSDNGCRDTVIKNISIIDSLKPDFTFPSSICQNAAIPFTNTSTGNYTAYIWNFRDSLNSTSSIKSPTFTYTKPGTYPVKLIVNHAVCGQDSTVKNIIVKPVPTVSLNQNIALCEGSTSAITVPAIYDSLRWNTNQITNTIIANGIPNPLSVIVYKNGCNATASTTLKLKPKPIADFATDKYCSNNPTVFINTSNVAPNDSIIQYNWNINNSVFTSTLKNPVFNLNQITSYTVQLIVTTNSGCRDTLVKVLSLRDTFVPDFIFPNAICLKSEVTFSDNSKGENIQFNWNFGDGQNSSDKNPLYTYLSQGNFNIKLTVQNKNCGTDSISKSITVKPLPQISLDDNIVMCPDEIITIFAGGDFDSVFWSNGTTINPTQINGNASPIVFTGFKLGCPNSDSIDVIQNCDIYIPTAFSPNNDGNNDAFNLIPVNIIDYTLRIFNRWGELLFETTDLAKGWDGTYKGVSCQTDTYVYYATGLKKDNQSFVIKGIFTLLR